MKYTLDESLFEEFEDEHGNGAGEGSYDRDEAATIRGTVSDLMNDTWNLINKLGATSDFMEEQYPSREDVIEILEAINTDEHNHIGQFEALLGAFSEGMDAVESGKEEAEGVLGGGEPAAEDENLDEALDPNSYCGLAAYFGFNFSSLFGPTFLSNNRKKKVEDNRSLADFEACFQTYIKEICAKHGWGYVFGDSSAAACSKAVDVMLVQSGADAESAIGTASEPTIYVTTDDLYRCNHWDGTFCVRKLDKFDVFDLLHAERHTIHLSNLEANIENLFEDRPLVEGIKQKSNGKWTNKGKDGEHGDFKTKKEARAQQKAMFANGWHEDLDADRAERIKKYKANKKGGCCGKGCDEKDVKDELEQPVNANAEVLTEETTEEAAEDNRVEKYFNTVSTSLCSMLGRWLRQHGYKLSGDCAAMIWDQLRRKENLGGNVIVDVNINTGRPLSAEDESSLRNVVSEWCDKMCNKDDMTCYDYCRTPEITDNGTGGVKLRLSFLDDDGAVVEFD